MSLRTTRLASMVLLVLAGCRSATEFSASIDHDPLPEIAARAAEADDASSVFWSEDGALEIRDTYVAHSIFTGGWTTFHTIMMYDEGVLKGTCYLRSINLRNLYVPEYIDAGPGFFGGALKPAMGGQLLELLSWGGVESSTVAQVHVRSRW